MQAIIPFLVLVSLASAQAPAPIIDVGYARYQGIVNTRTKISTYLGIRYAAAPVGNLRFRAPQSPPFLPGVQQATSRGPECWQTGPGNSPTNPYPIRFTDTSLGDDDCLFLNVHFPGSVVPTRPLPVVFWIHGGGYVGGSAHRYNGDDLVREALNGVVVVIIQYRLGIFGFLSGSKVKANGALNAGLLDQEFALKWVRQHISKFGGDPNRVTIWGESAGAGSVLQHVIARNGRTSPPLFRAAMSSSSFLPSQHPFNGAVPESIFNQVVSQVSCNSSPDVMRCLRAANITQLQTANDRVNRAGFFGTFATVPVIDGEFITERPTQALKRGRINGRALLAMTNTREGNDFVDQRTAGTVTAADYTRRLFPYIGVVNAATAARLYAGVGAPIDQVNAIMGEAIFICPTYFMLNAFPGTSYKGEFAVNNALHGRDITSYFPSSGAPAFNNPAFLIAFSGAFLNFATSLDPNRKIDRRNITPLWRTYNQRSFEMRFNRTAGQVGQPDIRGFWTPEALKGRCNFWERVSHLTAQ
ncbi:Carboxylic ester hydrolase [Pleurotus pulmonarius]